MQRPGRMFPPEMWGRSDIAAFAFDAYIRSAHRARSRSLELHRLKAWTHRQKHLAALLELRMDSKRERDFSLHLHETIGTAVRWRSADEALQTARDIVHRLQLVPEPPPRKGSPSIVSIRATDVALLAQSVNEHKLLGPQSLCAAMRIASLEPASADAFKLCLAVLWLANERAILELRGACSDRVVLHMTCAPRLARAERSIESFGADELTHLKLIGTGERYAFDVTSKLLGVPSRDTYECLPQKVFQGLALLTLACNPQCVLKLDDDHRLAGKAEVVRLLNYAAQTSEAVQLGEVNRTPLPSAHHRAWHFGKCGEAPVGSQVLEMPTPVKWAAGSAGYVLNRAALWRVLWSSIFYARWLDEIMYEDIALAEVATKTGIRIVKTDMRRAIGAVSDY